MHESNYGSQISGQEIGAELQRLRKAKGVALKKLAELSGVSFYVIRNIENGYVNAPDPAVVAKLKDVLGD